jgi:hypothetical protein
MGQQSLGKLNYRLVAGATTLTGAKVLMLAHGPGQGICFNSIRALSF